MEQAGVRKPTVFTAVGNEQTLLKVVRDDALSGGDEPIAANDRPLAVSAREEPDQERAILLAAASIMGMTAATPASTASCAVRPRAVRTGSGSCGRPANSSA